MSAPDPTQPHPRQPGPYPSGGHPATPLTYLQGGPVGFGEAIRQELSNGFVYRGRASRSAYWWFSPLTMNSSGGSFALLAIGGIVFLYLDLVLLALLVRRLHDIDKSGWWVFIGLVPFAGAIVLFVFTVLAGTPGLNRYQPQRRRACAVAARPRPAGRYDLTPTPGNYVSRILAEEQLAANLPPETQSLAVAVRWPGRRIGRERTAEAA